MSIESFDAPYPQDNRSEGDDSPVDLGYDPRIKNLSYSSLLTAHTCPRKYELDKKQSTSEDNETLDDKITFDFGHVVGHGIQLIMEDKSLDEVMWEMFLGWKTELWSTNPKQSKSFAHAFYAVQKFSAMRDQGYLQDYELVIYNDKPACELSFIVSLPNQFKLRGFVDAVLRHKYTGKIVVLECKTSSATRLNPAMYKNSAQAIGYSIVLDTIFPTLSSYEVLYLIYTTKDLQFEQYEFNKSYVQRARWIRELILDCDTLLMYEENDLFPMHGESCYDFFRECKYMNLCQMSTDRLTTPLTQKGYQEMLTKESEYQISVTLEDLITKQLEKA